MGVSPVTRAQQLAKSGKVEKAESQNEKRGAKKEKENEKQKRKRGKKVERKRFCRKTCTMSGDGFSKQARSQSVGDALCMHCFCSSVSVSLSLSTRLQKSACSPVGCDKIVAK